MRYQSDDVSNEVAYRTVREVGAQQYMHRFARITFSVAQGEALNCANIKK
jgi:hypothetical protein